MTTLCLILNTVLYQNNDHHRAIISLLDRRHVNQQPNTKGDPRYDKTKEMGYKRRTHNGTDINAE